MIARNLFFDKDDTVAFLAVPHLMQAARDMLLGSHLINGCSIGSRPHIRAYFRGFWPFVSKLGTIVDERPLPREPLNVAAGGKHEAARILIEIARTREQLVKQEAESLGWLSTRKATHAEYWREDASKLGIDLREAETTIGVLQLIDAFKTAETTAQFFGCLVAGEMVALALGEELGDGAFNNHGCSLWIDAHRVKQDISVLDINMSFMRAYAMTGDSESLQRSVLHVIDLFGTAADSVLDDLL